MRLYRVEMSVIVEAENEHDAFLRAESMAELSCNSFGDGSGVLTWEDPVVGRRLTKADVIKDHGDEEGTMEVLEAYDDDGRKP